MRPVRFVAVSEDGHAFVLADEVGRLLTLPIDDRVHTAMRADRGPSVPPLGGTAEAASSLSPRDIQARIRAGDTADDVARVAGVPVDRVLRYAGPVLQERAMLAQHARRTKLRTSDNGASLADVVDARLNQHGVDAEKISWDAYRRDNGTWRVVATWPSGKATAQAVWELDKSRQMVAPHDDMAQYLCSERPTQILGQDPVPERGESIRGGHERGHEPMRPTATAMPGRTQASDTARREHRPGRGLGDPGRGGVVAADPIRAGRDALMASLDRPLETTGGLVRTPAASADAGRPSRPGGAAGLIGAASGTAFDDEVVVAAGPKEVPTVPSLAVLRPRRTGAAATGDAQSVADRPRPKRLPSWDDVLFGSAPAARESS